ncbi:helix-turn-helix domain-containing protein [Streptomyces sp. NPDC007100]|uniref:helix-turn-helix domain-containing protein n=1 Tax=Streptomyces sp. NPDC007100 TaxID=3155602 RepID=UPI0033D9AB31
MTPAEAAAELSVSKRVLMDSYRRWGIPYLKVGKHVRFRIRDLHNWVDARMRAD